MEPPQKKYRLSNPAARAHSVLKQLSHLKYSLKINDSAVDALAANEIVFLLKEHPNLTLLNISCVRLDSEGFETVMKEISHTHIESIQLQHCMIPVPLMILGLPILQLTELSLSFSPIRDMGISMLASILPGSQIQVLNVSNTRSGVAGCIALGKALRTGFTAIQVLNYGFNDCGDGAYHIVDALPFSNVDTLMLTANDLGLKTVNSLMLNGGKLTSLHLNFTSLTEVCLEQIADMIESPGILLQHLNLDGNMTSLNRMRIITTAIRSNVRLQHVELNAINRAVPFLRSAYDKCFYDCIYGHVSMRSMSYHDQTPAILERLKFNQSKIVKVIVMLSSLYGKTLSGRWNLPSELVRVLANCFFSQI
jgi:Ran GTPase-activating protein (RanGAP) involved in mRNA processing and transport